jgi:hypothetical protein
MWSRLLRLLPFGVLVALLTTGVGVFLFSMLALNNQLGRWYLAFLPRTFVLGVVLSKVTSALNWSGRLLAVGIVAGWFGGLVAAEIVLAVYDQTSRRPIPAYVGPVLDACPAVLVGLAVMGLWRLTHGRPSSGVASRPCTETESHNKWSQPRRNYA